MLCIFLSEGAYAPYYICMTREGFEGWRCKGGKGSDGQKSSMGSIPKTIHLVKVEGGRESKAPERFE